MRLLQVSEAIPSSPWEMITHATPVTKFVLVLLAVLSLISWAIMFAKWWEFRAVRAASKSFLSEFEHQTSLEGANGLAMRSMRTPFTRVFDRAIRFIPETSPSQEYARETTTAVMSGSRVEALRFLLDSVTSEERDRLGRIVGRCGGGDTAQHRQRDGESGGRFASL